MEEEAEKRREQYEKERSLMFRDPRLVHLNKNNQ